MVNRYPRRLQKQAVTVPNTPIWQFTPYKAALALILFVTLLVFVPVITHDFTNWDDPSNVLENPAVMSPSWSQTTALWTKSTNSMYAPLVFITFIIDAFVSQGHPWSFHTTNLILHLAATASVFAILRLLLTSALLVPALVGALFFAIHPLQAEPVSWVTGRKDVLAGFLGLIAVYLQLKSNQIQDSPTVMRYRIAALLAFTSSLFAKTTGVALPFAILAVEVFVQRKPKKAAGIHLLPWIVIAGVFSLIAMGAQPIPEWIKNSVPFWRRPMLAGQAIQFYVEKTLWPLRLAPVYPVNAGEAAARHSNLFALMAAVLVTALAAFYNRRMLSIICIFAAPLLPVLGFVSFLYQEISLTADRYAYVSLLALSLGVAWALEKTVPRLLWYRAGTILCCLILGVFCVLTRRQTRIWKDSESLWSYTVRVSPGVAEAHANMAFVLHNKGDEFLPQAEEQFELAVKADPDFNMAWTMLGLIRLERDGPDASLPALQQAVRSIETKGYRDRRLAEAYNNLGAAYMRAKNYPTAEEQFRKALDVRLLPDAFANLISVLNSQEKRSDAELVVQEAKRLGVNVEVEDTSTSGSTHASNPE